MHAHGFSGAATPITPGQGDALYAWVYLDPEHPPRTLMLEWRSGAARRRAYWGENRIDLGTDGRTTRVPIGALPEPGRWLRLDVSAAQLELQDRSIEGMGFLLFDGRAAYGAAGVVTNGQETPWFESAPPAGASADDDKPFEALGLNQLLAPFEADHGVVSGAVDASGGKPNDTSATLAELAANPLLVALLSTAERAQLGARGVAGFIDYLKVRADRADDIVDYGFVKVQTDLYRLRQLMLNATDASRLAVSPALANIAQAETAVATHEDISKFLARIRSAQSENEETQPATGSDNTETPTLDRTAALAFAARRSTMDAALSNRVIFDSGIQERISQPKPAARTTSASSFDFTPIRASTLYTPTDVQNATPLTGNFNIRTLSIAARLQLPKAQEARDYATSTRHEAVNRLLRLADELIAEDGGVTPGLFKEIDVWGLAGDFGTEPDAPTPPRHSLVEFIAPATRATLVAALLRPPTRTRFDEATHFSDSTDLADRTVALLRQLEGRIARYRAVIAACESALNALRGDLSAVGARERVYADALAEARHDVAVTRALMSEEQARLDGINARRAAVLEKEVRFLAYQRPRTTDSLAPSVARTLDPGLLDAPVPACLRAHADAPEQLGELLRVLRESPAAWFGQGRVSLDRLDRLDLLLGAVQTARLRAPLLAQRVALPVVAQTGGLVASIARVQFARRAVLGETRAQALHANIAQMAQLNWRGLRAQAANLISLGDLIDGEQGRGLVARQAAAFFDRFEQISGCLHAGFSEIPPALRLDWADDLSQFDDAPDLRKLARLPRWTEIEYADRHRLQGLVDWMFDQIETSDERARALVNDMVRMCLLLASHAPVGRIIAGRLPRPVLARPGLRIPLVALERARLRIGMHALVFRGERVIARAVVEDIGDEVSARVLHSDGGEMSLTETDRVQFAEPAVVGLIAAPLF